MTEGAAGRGGGQRTARGRPGSQGASGYAAGAGCGRRAWLGAGEVDTILDRLEAVKILVAGKRDATRSFLLPLFSSFSGRFCGLIGFLLGGVSCLFTLFLGLKLFLQLGVDRRSLFFHHC